MTINRRASTGLAVIALALAVAPTAMGQRPEREPLPPSDPFVIEDICSFPVLLEELVNRATITRFSDGREKITGTLKIRLTNVDEPRKSRVFNISGPAHFRPTADGGVVLKGTGRWLWFFVPGELGEGTSGMMMLLSGHARLTISPEGELSFTVVGGRAQDVCTLLA
ncbi:MAG: hypothetical protein M3N24_07885 [Actinomycetota bacterium]|nr:hypothetical protein [Actinomycetota bacterium]